MNTPDFFPTFLELAGVTDPQTVQTVDGESMVKLFTDGSQYVARAAEAGKIRDRKDANAFRIPESVSGLADDRGLIFHYPHQLRYEDQDDIDFLSALRRGDWKLVYRMHTGELELYNLRDDIGEHSNVAAGNRELTRSMASELSDRLRHWNAPMPTVRATGKPVPMPDETDAFAALKK